MSKRKYFRTIDQIADEDFLWPLSQMRKGFNNPEENTRYRAISEVLRCIPNEDYERLKPKVDEFQWFIPDKDNLGGLYPFVLDKEAVRSKDGKVELPAHAQVLYLSPTLERRAKEVAVAVVAHELAHLVLDHDLIALNKDYDKQEHEAFECVCKWGFDKEAKKHRTSQKRRGISVG
jgi:hypothetical protein